MDNFYELEFGLLFMLADRYDIKEVIFEKSKYNIKNADDIVISQFTYDTEIIIKINQEENKYFNYKISKKCLYNLFEEENGDLNEVYEIICEDIEDNFLKKILINKGEN